MNSRTRGVQARAKIPRFRDDASGFWGVTPLRAHLISGISSDKNRSNLRKYGLRRGIKSKRIIKTPPGLPRKLSGLCRFVEHENFTPAGII